MPRAEHDPIPTRRFLLSTAALAPFAAHSPAAAPPDADAELIGLCSAHIAALRAYNRANDALVELEDHPLWQACQRTEEAIEARPPQTLAGIVAKARLAAAEAREAYLDDEEQWDGGASTTWARQVVCDLLRLYGGPDQ
jgi:hypothetical protein